MKKTMLLVMLVIIMLSLPIYSQKQFHPKAIPDKQKGNIIFGLLTKQDNTYYLTKNWRSRSLVTYTIEGKTDGLDMYINKPVIAKGKIIKANQPPLNRFAIESISKCWEPGKPMQLKGHVKKGQRYTYFIENPLPGERLMYIIKQDNTKSIEKYDTKHITVSGIITEENNWSKIYLEVEKIEEK